MIGERTPDYGAVIPVDFKAKQRDAQDDRSTPPLKDGDGGGTFDDMEQRVSRLEKSVDQLLRDVSELKVDVATVRENMRHLPTKHEVDGIMTAAIDRAAAKTHRVVGITGTLVAIVVAAVNFGPRLLGG